MSEVLELLSSEGITNLVRGIQVPSANDGVETLVVKKRIPPFAVSRAEVAARVQRMRTGKLLTDLYTVFTSTHGNNELYIIGPEKTEATPTLLTRNCLSGEYRFLPKIKLEMVGRLLTVSVGYENVVPDGPAVRMHLVDTSNYVPIMDQSAVRNSNRILFAALPITDPSPDNPRNNMLILSVRNHPVVAIGGELIDFGGNGTGVPTATITLSKDLFNLESVKSRDTVPGANLLLPA